MPLGCLIFHEQKGLQLREWQSHLINLTAKVVCLHQDCMEDIFCLTPTNILKGK